MPKRKELLDRAETYFGKGRVEEDYFLNIVLSKEYNFSSEELNSDNLNTDGKWDSKIDHILVLIDDKYYEDIREIEKEIDKRKKNISKIEFFIFQIKNRTKTSFQTNEALLMRSTLKDMVTLEEKYIELLPYNDSIKLLSKIVKNICNNLSIQIKMNVYYIIAKGETQSQTKEEVMNIGKVLEEEIMDKKRVKVNFSTKDLDDLKESLDYIIENNKKYCLEFSKKRIIEMDNKVIIVPTVAEYYKFLSFKGGNLFDKNLAEGNVRYFLGENSVNNEIINTLKEIKKQKGQSGFLERNNGITIIVDDYKIDENKIILISPKIVNGLQTSNSIFLVLNQEEDIIPFQDQDIMLKIVKSENRDHIKEICWGSNNQNAITKSDLKTLDEIHQDLQKMFEDRKYIYFIKNNNESKNIKNEIYMSDISKAYFIFELKDSRTPKIKGDSILEKDYFNKVFKEENKEKLIEYTIFYKKMLSFLEEIEENIFNDQDNSLIKYITILSITYLMVEKIELEEIKKLSNEITIDQFRNKFIKFSKLIIAYCEEKDIKNDISRKSKTKALNEEFYNWIEEKNSKKTEIKTSLKQTS
ncbi:MAG: AIPR family protein [Fusobacterium ulcerans]|uniref:AIPR family protein n=1 Tax=Fusobacterium ulcerans TaxID=861 RepID=UPI003A8718BA